MYISRFADAAICVWRFLCYSFILFYLISRFIFTHGISSWLTYIFLVCMLCLTIDIVMYMLGIRIFITSNRRIVANIYNGSFKQSKSNIKAGETTDDE